MDGLDFMDEAINLESKCVLLCSELIVDSTRLDTRRDSTMASFTDCSRADNWAKKRRGRYGRKWGSTRDLLLPGYRGLGVVVVISADPARRPKPSRTLDLLLLSLRVFQLQILHPSPTSLSISTLMTKKRMLRRIKLSKTPRPLRLISLPCCRISERDIDFSLRLSDPDQD